MNIMKNMEYRVALVDADTNRKNEFMIAKSSRRNVLLCLRRSWSLCARYAALLFLTSNVLAQTAPTVITQPQSQTAIAGSNVTFWVTVGDGSAPAPLPSVSSGMLQLWLKADAGVVSNTAGLVSAWQDQSGNANHASQANATNQPSLVFPAALGGRAAIRFNGNQDNIHGSYLKGTGLVGVSNAMTAFTVYNAFSTINDKNVVWMIGVPQFVWGGCRGDGVADGGELVFSTFTYDYIPGFVVPTNTYRIWTDRVDTNLDTVNIFDETASTATNYTMSMTGAQAPQAGYYVGGLDPTLQDGGGGLNLDGDVAEIICYQGYLSEPDRLAVLGYMQQKYYLSKVNNNVSYQWQFDSTNIPGATNAILTLANVQTNEAGSYSVVVTDLAGSTNSSGAFLTVKVPPSITVQPMSQEIGQGSNVSFTVNASGTPPLDYQWSLNGVALAQATNSTLTLTNVVSANSGSYAILVSNPYGSVLSSNAVLTIDLLPSIIAQPHSQDAVVGENTVLSVGATLTPLPTVLSGTLRLWLEADMGVVTNTEGQVSQWQDQSGNTNHADQTNTLRQPMLVAASGLGGRAAVRFDGIQTTTNGAFLHGVELPLSGVSGALTAFTVYDANSITNAKNVIWMIGVPGSGFGDCRGLGIAGADLVFSGYGDDYTAPFVVPTNTYRICADSLDTNLDTLNVYDTTATSATNFNFAVSGMLTPGAGYYVGGLDPALRSVGAGLNFDGDIAEMICYQGYLNEADRLAVTSYLEQKYYQNVSSSNLTYQWQFDGTNIEGATNATLTLASFQTNDSGTYTVIVTSPEGSVSSSNAVLTPVFAPVITSSPSNQIIVIDSTVTLTAAATGTAPLTYQWQFDGTNISGATNTSLTLTNAQPGNTGTYRMVATNPYGSATSSAAILTVEESTIQVVSGNAIGGGTVTVSIDLNALGTETALGLSLDFNPAVLTFSGVVLGGGGAGGELLVNSNQASSGLLGLGVDLFSGAFSPGTNDVFDLDLLKPQ